MSRKQIEIETTTCLNKFPPEIIDNIILKYIWGVCIAWTTFTKTEFENRHKTDKYEMRKYSLLDMKAVNFEVFELPDKWKGSHWANRGYIKCSDFSYADLSDAKLVFGSHYYEAGGSNFEYAILNGTKLLLHGGCNFSNADLVFADLSFSSLAGSTFNNANLQYVNLKQAKLQRTQFINADLRFANLNQAYLYEADLTGALLDGADFTKANLNKAKFNPAQFRWAKINFIADMYMLHCEDCKDCEAKNTSKDMQLAKKMLTANLDNDNARKTIDEIKSFMATAQSWKGIFIRNFNFFYHCLELIAKQYSVDLKEPEFISTLIQIMPGLQKLASNASLLKGGSLFEEKKSMQPFDFQAFKALQYVITLIEKHHAKFGFKRYSEPLIALNKINSQDMALKWCLTHLPKEKELVLRGIINDSIENNNYSAAPVQKDVLLFLNQLSAHRSSKFSP